MARYAAAIDQGTTSTRFMIFDHSGKVIALDQKEHEQIYPQPGWVEHSPLEIWERTQAVIAGALKQSGVEAKDLAAVGVTNQRETTVVWDKATGQPVYNAIVWQDTRTADITGALVQWLRDNLGLIQNSADVETLAKTVDDNGGIYFVPAFSGLYAPYWKDTARGVIAGLTRYIAKGHIKWTRPSASGCMPDGRRR